MGGASVNDGRSVRKVGVVGSRSDHLTRLCPVRRDPTEPLTDLLGQPDQYPLRAADVAEAVRVRVLHDLGDEFRAAIAKPGERVIDVVNGEHDSEVAEGVDRRVTVICDYIRFDEAG
jgi:hypothetical protein